MIASTSGLDISPEKINTFEKDQFLKEHTFEILLPTQWVLMTLMSL